MPYQNIDASVSLADLQTIEDAFGTIKQKLPFLVNLTAEERKAIFKTGPDRFSFVQNALTAAQSHKELFPPTFSIQGFQRDVELFAVLTELQSLAESITSQVDDTRLAVGGESMRQATQVYSYVKEAAKTTPGLKPLADQLGDQFQKASRAKAASHPTS